MTEMIIMTFQVAIQKILEFFFTALESFFIYVGLVIKYRTAKLLRLRTKNYKSYELLSHYNRYGAKHSTIVKEILWHGDYNFQIPSKVLYKGASLKGCTVLHIALKKGDYKTFEVLVKNGADFTIKNDAGVSVLHQAFENLQSNVKDSKKFIDSVLSAHVSFAEVNNPRCSNGISHFHVACAMNNVEAVRMFLRNGVPIDETVHSNSTIFPGYSALHFAAKYGCLRTVEILLDEGANFRLKDARGLTPLHLLIERNMAIVDWKNMGMRAPWEKLKLELETNERIIDMILTECSNDLLDDTKLSSFHVACTLQDTSIVERLLNNAVSIDQPVATNSPLWAGYTALHFAAHFNPETVTLLLKNKANFLAKDAAEVTPLDLCMQRYEVEVLHRLISLDSTLKQIRFSDGTTSLLDAIIAMKDKETLNDFLDNVADINMSIRLDSPLWPGYTLLHLATGLTERKDGISNHFHFSNDADRINDLDKSYNCGEDEIAIYVERIKILLKKGVDVTIKDFNNSTALHLAFKLKKESAFSQLLESHQGLINSIDSDNLSDLHIACAADNEVVVANLLSKAVKNDVNCAVSASYKYRITRNQKCIISSISISSTPLHIAVSNRSIEIVKLLLNNDADIYAEDSNGVTPIHQLLVQASKDNIGALKDIASVLLSVDDLRERETSFGLSHLHVASYANNVTAIEKLLIDGANVNATISTDDLLDEELNSLNIFEGYTPLHVALQYANLDAIVALVRGGANFLAVPSPKIGYELHKKHSDYLASTLMRELASQEVIRETFGLTMLHVACATVDVERVRDLLNKGVDPNEQVLDKSPLWSGDTALHLLMIKRDHYPLDDIEAIVKSLLDHGADGTIQNSSNMTCLHKAFLLFIVNTTAYQLKHFPGLLLSKQRDFSINPVNDEGWSHFHMAVYFERIQIVEEFLKHHFDINQPIDYLYYLYGGFSPIHIASFYHCAEIVDLLLSHGADIHTRNTDGRTPFHEAGDYSYFTDRQLPYPSSDTFYCMALAGAPVHTKTPMGETHRELYIRSMRHVSETYRNVKRRVNVFNSVRDEGFIAMSISHETDFDDVSQNYEYCAVINAPKKNYPDEKGRSVIHNVVSIWETNTSTDVYIKVIKKFMELQFDLDHKDVNGCTALHCAMKFQNLNAIRALFTLGSDINVVDINGKTPLSYAWEFYKEELHLSQTNHRSFFEEIFSHIYKLNLAHIYVNNINREIEESFKKYTNLDANAIKRVEDEAEKLKMKTLDSLDMSLWDFLPETAAVSSYPRFKPYKRKIIDDYFRNNVVSSYEEFPEFAGLLQLQHRKAANRVDLIERAEFSFSLLTDYMLPDLCCNHVFVHLNNGDLENLIEVGDLFLPKQNTLKDYFNNGFCNIRNKYSRLNSHWLFACINYGKVIIMKYRQLRKHSIDE